MNWRHQVNQVRNSAKAIIIHHGQLLAIKFIDAEGEWFSLPGGGQEPGESLHQALQRECLEEFGLEVEIGPLRYIREYIGSHHEFSDRDSETHQVEFMFICSLSGTPPEMKTTRPDPGQVGTAWLPVIDLTKYRLYPKSLRPLLEKEPDQAGPIYLGDVN
jgi:8-oxo-dGTP diphosphatase